jgi:lipopolysaccharide export system permease protein
LTLLDRYLCRSVLATCLAAVSLFAFVLIVGNAIRDLLPLMLSGQLEPDVFVRLLLLLVPFVISYALPLGMLTGVLLTLGRLSSDNEVTAMRAAGLSLARIARPVFVLGFLGMLLGLRVNFESMPWARVQYHRELASAVRANPLNFIVPRTFIRNFSGYVLYVGAKDGTVLHDFWLWQLDADHRAIRLLRAESGRVDFDEATNELVLNLTHGRIETRDPKQPEGFADSPYIGSFEQSEPIRLPAEKLLGAQVIQRKTQWMTYRELRAEEVRLAALPSDPAHAAEHAQARMKLALIIQEKFTLALAVFSFAFIGVPLGIKVSRRETSANLGLAVALALGYNFLTVMVGWLDKHPEYRPDLLLWVPNLILLGLGLWLLRRLDRA